MKLPTFKITTNCKPCPFCGVLNPSLESHEAGTADRHIEYWIACTNCGAIGPSDLGRSGAVEMWNMRREYNPNHPNNYRHELAAHPAPEADQHQADLLEEWHKRL